MEEIKKRVRSFKRNETFHYLTMLNNYLCLGDGAIPDDNGSITDDKTTRFIKVLFYPYLQTRIIELWLKANSSHGVNRIAFSRIQLLTLMKFILLWGDEDGELIPNESFGATYELGDLLLMLTDFFDSELSPTLEGTLAQILPGIELTNHPPRLSVFDLITRSYEYIQILKNDRSLSAPNGLAWPDLFEEKEKVSIETLLVIVASILVQYIKFENFNNYLNDPGQLNFSRKGYFLNFKKSDLQLDSFFRLSSRPIDLLSRNVKELKGGFSVKHDFLLFRDTPIIFISEDIFTCIDIHFLLEKFTSNLVYIIEASLPSEKSDLTRKNQLYLRQWRSHYGKAVEIYVGNIFDEAAPGTHQRNSNFIFRRNKYEIDGVMDYYSTLIWMECKGKKLSAKAKYSGDPQLLFQELENKYGLSDKNAAVRQLTKKLAIVFHPEYHKELSDWKFGFPTTVHPLLIVEDELLGFDVILDRLNDLFLNEIESLPISRFVEIRPLDILTITDIERIEVYMVSEGVTFLEILDFACKFHQSKPRLEFSAVITEFIRQKKLVRKINKRLDVKFDTDIMNLINETFSE